MTERGVGNTRIYEFKGINAADKFFRRCWVARLLVDSNGAEVRASSGLNPRALRRLRGELLARQSTEYTVVVTNISGEHLETDLSGSANMGDVKDCVESSWGVACEAQELRFGTELVADHKTVSSLSHDIPGALHLTLTAEVDIPNATAEANDCTAQTHYEEILQRVTDERAKPTNAASMIKLARLLRQADRLEEAMLSKGTLLDRRIRRVRVREKPSTLTTTHTQKNNSVPLRVGVGAMIRIIWNPSEMGLASL